MENISIRLPYISEASHEGKEKLVTQYALLNSKRTDLSNLLDKDRNRFEDNEPTIMLIFKNSNEETKVNYSCSKKVNGKEDVSIYKTWYECLLPIIKLSEEDFERIARIADNNIVEFGYFPSTLIKDKDEEERLRQCKRKFTGNRYTLPISSYYKGGKKVKYEIKENFVAKRIVDLESFPEYEIDGERYITYKAKGCDERIYKVVPLIWYVDTKNKELMCTALPVCGIIYSPHPRRRSIINPRAVSIKRELSYDESHVRKYLEINIFFIVI